MAAIASSRNPGVLSSAELRICQTGFGGYAHGIVMYGWVRLLRVVEKFCYNPSQNVFRDAWLLSCFPLPNVNVHMVNLARGTFY